MTYEKTDMKAYFEQLGVSFAKIGSAWRANCPLCQATNALEVKLLEPERWYCHACCEHHPYDLTDLQLALGGGLPEPSANGTAKAQKDFDHCRPSSGYVGLRSFFENQREFPECVLDRAVEIAKTYLRYDVAYWRDGDNGEKEYTTTKTGFLVAPVFDAAKTGIKNVLIGTQRLCVTDRKWKMPYGHLAGIFPVSAGSKEIVFVESVANAVALAVVDITAVCIFSASNVAVIAPAIARMNRQKGASYHYFLWLDATKDGSQVDAHAQTALEKSPSLVQVKFGPDKPDNYDINDLLVATGENFGTEVRKMLGAAFAQKKSSAGIVDSTPADFPLHVYPAWLRSFCEQTAGSINVPMDYVAPFVLPLIGAALGKNKIIRLHEDWSESARIYMAAVGEASSGKSVALDKMTDPLRGIEARFAEENARSRERYECEKLVYGIEKEKKKAALRESKEYELPAAPSAPRYYRAVTTDATVESLHGILLDNESLLLKYDEISGLVSGMNAYKKGGADREYYLGCWAGADVTVDRKSNERGAMYVKSPHLSIAGLTVPSKVHLLVADDKGNDGMTARFVFVVPDERQSPRYSNLRVDEGNKALWQAELEKFYADRNGNFTYRVTHQGQAQFEICYNSLADAIDTESSEVMRSWLGKARGYILRFALVLAALHDTAEVNEKIIADAKTLVDYFTSHARKSFALAALGRGLINDDKEAVQQDLAQKIVKYCARRNINSISVRTACRAEIQARLKAEQVRIVFAGMIQTGVATVGHAKDSIILNV